MKVRWTQAALPRLLHLSLRSMVRKKGLGPGYGFSFQRGSGMPKAMGHAEGVGYSESNGRSEGLGMPKAMVRNEVRSGCPAPMVCEEAQ